MTTQILSFEMKCMFSNGLQRKIKEGNEYMCLPCPSSTKTAACKAVLPSGPPNVGDSHLQSIVPTMSL